MTRRPVPEFLQQSIYAANQHPDADRGRARTAADVDAYVAPAYTQPVPPPPVPGKPEDLLTDLHKIADRARDDIRNEAQLIRKRGIYYSDRVNGQLLAFAFAYIRPYDRTTEQINAAWLGIDQGMKEYNRPR